MEWMKEAVDYVIFGILGLMGFVALWLTIERMLFLKRYRPGDYASEEERGIALTKNFTTLYIIYSNAPYVGLLGTVIGIMLTFYDMGSTGAIDAGRIMTGLSLAFKVTALGLAVAIPTLISYNGQQRAMNVASRRRA